MSFMRHHSDTAQIQVRYVPAPITGTVFAGTGTVWKIPTRSIPVPNPISKEGKVDPPLPAGGNLTIGYGPGEPRAFKFDLKKEEVDVGFLKLFLTTDYIDFSNVSQPSPFAATRDVVDYDDSKKLDPVWDSILIPVVQRRG